MKYEWRKIEKEIYGVKEEPKILEIPRQRVIAIKGKGNPNKEDFLQRVSVLFPLAYQIKSRYKALHAEKAEPYAQSEYHDYTVFPLEGVWTSTSTNPLEKDCFVYTIMIRQPDFITKEIMEAAYETVKKKKPHPLWGEVIFDTMEEGRCVQILHKGSFDEEPFSFSRMDGYIAEKGYSRLNHCHREIYLNDARKTIPEKRQTILRYQICGSN